MIVEIVLIAALIVSNVVWAVWQHQRLIALQAALAANVHEVEQRLTKRDAGLIVRYAKTQVAALDMRQTAFEKATTAHLQACASRAEVAEAAETFGEKCAVLADRLDVCDAVMRTWPQALTDTLTLRFKEYVRSERITKLENSLDGRVVDLIKATIENPLEQNYRKCSRCERMVARYEWFADSQTAICANCNYKIEFK